MSVVVFLQVVFLVVVVFFAVLVVVPVVVVGLVVVVVVPVVVLVVVLVVPLVVGLVVLEVEGFVVEVVPLVEVVPVVEDGFTVEIDPSSLTTIVYLGVTSIQANKPSATPKSKIIAAILDG